MFLSVWKIILTSLLCVAATKDIDSSFSQDQVTWHFSAMGGGVRAIVKKVLSVEQAEGVGARVRRSVGRPEVKVIGGIPYYCSSTHLDPVASQ